MGVNVIANQWTGFYMIGPSVMGELNQISMMKIPILDFSGLLIVTTLF